VVNTPPGEHFMILMVYEYSIMKLTMRAPRKFELVNVIGC